jgi:hypothetical protein
MVAGGLLCFNNTLHVIELQVGTLLVTVLIAFGREKESVGQGAEISCPVPLLTVAHYRHNMYLYFFT